MFPVLRLRWVLTSSVCTAVLAWQPLKVDYFKLMSLFWTKSIIWVISHVALFGKKLYAIGLLSYWSLVFILVIWLGHFYHVLGHILSKGSPAYMSVSHCCKSWWISWLDKSGNGRFMFNYLLAGFLYPQWWICKNVSLSSYRKFRCNFSYHWPRIFSYYKLQWDCTNTCMRKCFVLNIMIYLYLLSMARHCSIFWSMESFLCIFPCRFMVKQSL